MCARFSLNVTAAELSALGIYIAPALLDITYEALPSTPAAVVVKERSGLKLTRMRFSLVPGWSQEPKVPFATHNARIESVLEKPTWRIPFKSQHCVVPLGAFYESVYEGLHAGHVLRFSEADDKLLFAAGIFDRWVNPLDSKDSFFSFSILTREASPFILENGHDRTPIFIRPDDVGRWLDLTSSDGGQIRSELLSFCYHPDLKIEVDRPLKKGWEKRR